jgi:hypothetical protein
LSDLVQRWLWAFTEQMTGRHDDARGADATLRAAAIQKSLLHGV